jgi:serine/threonine-protein kinase RsbW
MRKYPEQVLLRFQDPQYFNIVRDNTEHIARNMGFDEDRVYELCLAVDEAYSNAIEHSGDLEGNNLEVEFLIFKDRLEISVSDSGCGFDLTRLKIPRSLKYLKKVRGRGLSLIKQLSDQLEMSSIPGSGTLVRIIKFVSQRHKRRVAKKIKTV